MVSVACESHRTQKENRRGALVKLAALVREAALAALEEEEAVAHQRESASGPLPQGTSTTQ